MYSTTDTYHFNKNALTENKSLPIQMIRISDSRIRSVIRIATKIVSLGPWAIFGLPDPKRDPDRHQKFITWSLSHALPLQKISSDRQTDRQTNRPHQKHNLLLSAEVINKLTRTHARTHSHTQIWCKFVTFVTLYLTIASQYIFANLDFFSS